MAIVQELNQEWFVDRFREMGRGDQFSIDALYALYDYYDQLSDDTGEDYRLDVIAICCDWYESTPEEFSQEYDIETDEGQRTLSEVIYDYLESETIFFELDNGNFLYQAF